MTLPRRTFEEILPLLVSTYMEGRLVPFLGAGVGVGRIALWDEFVKNLEDEAGISFIQSARKCCRGDEDDGAVDDAVRELLDEITRPREQHEEPKAVHFQLSSTGGTFPPVFAFMKVVRAFGGWKREKDIGRSQLQLILHIESDVEFNLTSGRINVQELLSSELIHFWAIVSREPVRRVLYYKEELRSRRFWMISAYHSIGG